MNIITSLLILLAAAITAGGQLLFKKGSLVLKGDLGWEKAPFVNQQLFKKIITILFEPHIFTALLLYFLGLFLWIKILSRTELSYAYPILVSFAVLATSVSSVFLFKETVTGFKLLGAILIIAGIFLMTKSS